MPSALTLISMSQARQWGRNIHHHRTKVAGLSQQQLAVAVGVHQTTVSKWEKGICTPSHRLIPALAKALCASPEILFPYQEVA